MTVRDNPVKRIRVVRKVGGKFGADVQGKVRVPIKLKLVSVPTPKTRTIFPVGSVEMGSPAPSPP
jgi:hypothetical protein